MRYTKEKEEITGFTAEAWHIRYVGEEHAQYMKEHDLCLEEYIQGIEDGTIKVPAKTERADEDPDEQADEGADEEETPEDEPEEEPDDEPQEEPEEEPDDAEETADGEEEA